ncbi:hypothetical protein [Streptomyces sp. ISL-96]|uniref:hypothetical protein n=1 Tax=Streptomyces sp. ISL-96 TaxID=2819191 RepID=UPI0035ABB1A9
MAERLVSDVFDALDEQTVIVPGTTTLDVVVPSLARSPRYPCAGRTAKLTIAWADFVSIKRGVS